jgi:signal peptidase I
MPSLDASSQPSDVVAAKQDSPASPPVLPLVAASVPQSNVPFRDHSPSRLLLRVSVGFVTLFLLLRTLVLEPFGVPTGSMAPALLGNHREGNCPRCNYPVKVGFPSPGGNATDHFRQIGCPNCGKHFSLLEARDLNGDRLLVDKNVFNLRLPRRWEMAVFHCPDTDPNELGKPYVKRVIGLPGEIIRIIDGDIYANDLLVRKNLAEVQETREVVFDMAFVPKTQGWNSRWLVEPPENDPRLPLTTPKPVVEAESNVVRGGTLILDASDPAHPSAAIRYRHWNLDERKVEPIRAWSSYDGVPRLFHQLPPVHDFSFVCEIEVVSALPEAVFACDLFDGADTVQAEVSIGSPASGLITLTHDRHGGLASARGFSLETHNTYRLEFAFVDRRVSLAIDGKTVLPPVDLPAIFSRAEVSSPVQLKARGCRLAIRNFTLYRDIYYTQFGEHGTQDPAVLSVHEFFVLGDNSGNSQDSRKWPNPGVPDTDFIGKPFLIHQPLHPAKLTVAGEERVFQTLDWSRLRWLH